ncbi:sporulation protein [Dactylosporangium sucinum]|uniref:Uncharacterized protein n=1 Tax=Dactylosporangium sucinum TaxID=1424081 RepID=A0A917X5I5_9ACTN|nr:hypothetical protein GCM10007977_084230 [Dactylosporangium sucinum]
MRSPHFTCDRISTAKARRDWCINIGVRTEVAVASGSAKGDFDPARLDASPAHQHIMDALGTIGCRFVRTTAGVRRARPRALPPVSE